MPNLLRDTQVVQNRGLMDRYATVLCRAYDDIVFCYIRDIDRDKRAEEESVALQRERAVLSQTVPFTLPKGTGRGSISFLTKV